MPDDAVSLAASIYECCEHLSDDDIAFLKAIEGQIPIVADISRADVLLCSWRSGGKPAVLAHARPHSVAAVHSRSMVGRDLDEGQERSLLAALRERLTDFRQSATSDGAPIVIQSYPVWRPEQRQIIGTLRIETNLLEYERQRRRARQFRRAALQLQRMAQYGLLIGAEDIGPFGETDGVIVVDRERTIRYISGVGMNLYRRIGYLGGLVGRPLSNLATADDNLARSALGLERCTELEEEVGGRYWIKKAIPVRRLPRPPWLRWLAPRQDTEAPSHVILIMRDSTETRRQEQELRVKTALIQELHHRVKNNLQTIAALLRMQARRLQVGDARLAVEEAVNRILSVAVIHEFLSNQDSRVINMREVGNRILTQLRQGLLSPDKHITFGLEGPPIYLPSRQATACALVINELLQNAVEHGFQEGASGHIQVTLQDEGDAVIVRVRDDGSGLPESFSLVSADSLGLQIVQTLVREDLKGTIDMCNGDGVEAIVSFPKSAFGGEQ
jgi:two-component system, sensor histidine kinase PdtaS